MKETTNVNQPNDQKPVVPSKKKFNIPLFIVLLIVGGFPGLIYGLIYAIDHFTNRFAMRKTGGRPLNGNVSRMIWIPLSVTLNIFCLLHTEVDFYVIFSIIALISAALSIVVSLFTKKLPLLSFVGSTLYLVYFAFTLFYAAINFLTPVPIYIILGIITYLFSPIAIIGIVRGFKYPVVYNRYLKELAKLESENVETQPTDSEPENKTEDVAIDVENMAQ